MRLLTPRPIEVHASPEDYAMGLELEAIELESRLEWAEAQGRDDDVKRLRRQLASTLAQLADVAEAIADHRVVPS